MASNEKKTLVKYSKMRQDIRTVPLKTGWIDYGASQITMVEIQKHKCYFTQILIDEFVIS